MLKSEFIGKNKNNFQLCSICCDEYNQEDKILKMNCVGKHVYHYNCIIVWLQKKRTCPNCNTNALGNTNNT